MNYYYFNHKIYIKYKYHNGFLFSTNQLNFGLPFISVLLFYLNLLISKLTMDRNQEVIEVINIISISDPTPPHHYRRAHEVLPNTRRKPSPN
jgi:hypothetical protein